MSKEFNVTLKSYLKANEVKNERAKGTANKYGPKQAKQNVGPAQVNIL